MDLRDFRQNYTKGELLENLVHPHPIEQFKRWFTEAMEAKIIEPNAMTLSTASDNQVSSRIVLLKSVGEGFTFFTNYSSKKGMDLSKNPQASLLFFWPELQRQIRIEGMVVKIATVDSKNYFKSRPLESQLGANVSAQSSVINSREELEKSYANLAKEFEGKEVPMPENWGGYELIPSYFEFWQGRPSRLHDRIAYQKVQTDWEIFRLAP